MMDQWEGFCACTQVRNESNCLIRETNGELRLYVITNVAKKSDQGGGQTRTGK